MSPVSDECVPWQSSYNHVSVPGGGQDSRPRGGGEGVVAIHNGCVHYSHRRATAANGLPVNLTALDDSLQSVETMEHPEKDGGVVGVGGGGGGVGGGHPTVITHLMAVRRPSSSSSGALDAVRSSEDCSACLRIRPTDENKTEKWTRTRRMMTSSSSDTNREMCMTSSSTNKVRYMTSSNTNNVGYMTSSNNNNNVRYMTSSNNNNNGRYMTSSGNNNVRYMTSSDTISMRYMTSASTNKEEEPRYLKRVRSMRRRRTQRCTRGANSLTSAYDALRDCLPPFGALRDCLPPFGALRDCPPQSGALRDCLPQSGALRDCLPPSGALRDCLHPSGALQDCLPPSGVLRNCLPTSGGPPDDERLTKVDTLRYATRYIAYMMNLLEQPAGTVTDCKISRLCLGFSL